MIFSSSTTYAMRAVLYLTINSSKNRKAGIREVAEKLDVPFHFLGKIMQTLSRHQVISSIKGPNGGFYLTREEMELPMMKVVEIFEPSNLFFQCGLGLKECSGDQPCPIHNDYKLFRTELYNRLSNQSISQWADQVKIGNVRISM